MASRCASDADSYRHSHRHSHRYGDTYCNSYIYSYIYSYRDTYCYPCDNSDCHTHCVTHRDRIWLTGSIGNPERRSERRPVAQYLHTSQGRHWR